MASCHWYTLWQLTLTVSLHLEISTVTDGLSCCWFNNYFNNTTERTLPLCGYWYWGVRSSWWGWRVSNRHRRMYNFYINFLFDACSPIYTILQTSWWCGQTAMEHVDYWCRIGHEIGSAAVCMIVSMSYWRVITFFLYILTTKLDIFILIIYTIWSPGLDWMILYPLYFISSL